MAILSLRRHDPDQVLRVSARRNPWSPRGPPPSPLPRAIAIWAPAGPSPAPPWSAPARSFSCPSNSLRRHDPDQVLRVSARGNPWFPPGAPPSHLPRAIAIGAPAGPSPAPPLERSCSVLLLSIQLPSPA